MILPRPMLLLALLLPLGGCAAGDAGDTAGGTDVPDGAPALTLESPRDGEAFAEGATVTIAGAVEDDRDAAATLTVTVSTDLDGTVATPDIADDGSFTTPVTITPGDEALTVTVVDSAGNVASATVNITLAGDAVDDPPTAPTLHVLPTMPVSGDTLLAILDTPPEDPEGVAVAVAYLWSMGDGTTDPTEFSSDAAVDGDSVVRGQVWVVEAWGNDRTQDGAHGSATVTIANAPPTAVGAFITPFDAGLDDPLVCNIFSPSDAEDDPITYTYGWTVAGVAAGDGTATLAAGIAEEGQDVVCSATLDDGFDTTTVQSGPIQIGNDPPGAAGVAIEPASPADTDDLACTIASPAEDPDGDPLVYTYTWSRDGVATGFTTPDIAAAETHRDEVWTCAVTATDPDGLSGTGTASVTIGPAFAGAVSASDADVTISGGVANGAFGKTVAFVGDLDGDSLSELLIGANGEDDSDGVVYLFAGASLTGALTTADALGSWDGTYEDGQLGGFRSVAVPGDLDHDGATELWFAAADADDNGSGSGVAYLVYGGGTLADHADPADADWSFTATAGDQAGARLAAGDLDGDGESELFVAAPGASDGGTASGTVAVFAGDATRRSGASTSADADWLVTGAAAGDGLGWTVKTVGDVDGDGYVDAVFGAMYADGAGSESGEAGLVLGGPGRTGTSSLATAAATRFAGDAAGDRLGYDVVGEIDLDEDGTEDLLVGAYQDDGGAVDAGAVFVYLGRAGWASAYGPGDADSQIEGSTAAGRFGHVMATPGDLDGDGVGDVLIGALFDDPDGLAYQGAAYLLGGPDWAAPRTDADIPWQAGGEDAGDLFGDALAVGRGDVSGDGADDFAVGAQGHDTAALAAGRVYVWFGR
jgi:hypothetical protein